MLNSNAIGSQLARESLPLSSKLPGEVQALVERIYAAAKTHVFSMVGSKKLSESDIEAAEAILMQLFRVLSSPDGAPDGRLAALSQEYGGSLRLLLVD